VLQIAFPRAGRARDPLYLDLEPTHDGRSIGHLRAVAWQGEEASRRLVATASILVDQADDGHDHQYAAAVPGDPMAAKPVDYAVIPGEVRLVGEGLDVAAAAPADLAFWMRCPDFADAALAQPVIAYISDWPLIGTLLKAVPGVSERDAHVSVQTGVVTHSLWFHQPFDVAQWLRVQIHGVRLAGGRGFGTGAVYTESGAHVASFAQESVIRTPRKECSMTAQHFVRYDLDDKVAVITLDRPDAANAQTAGILKDLDDAWRRADEDPEVRVIVLTTTGKHFSAGHDMTGVDPSADGRALGPRRTDGKLIAEDYYDWETRGYLEYARRWRDIPKPTIAAVQGKCIAAGLMLCWPCDLIVAADNAQFSDPVGLMGIMGIEYHAHTWEFGPRKAKEMLFTASSVTAEEARRSGMVNHVVPLDELRSFTMELAHRVAQTDPWALRLAKRAVNHTMDTMGFSTAIDSCFDMHHLGHIRALAATGGQTVVMADLERMKAAGRVK
jgi:enoyl-CoA hydratase